MLRLPDNPTDAQLKTIALETLKRTFESDIVEIGEIAAIDGGWATRYRTKSGQAFEVEYTPADGFLKSPIPISSFAEPIELSGSTELLDNAEWDALAESVSDAGVIEDVMDAIGKLDDQP